MSDPRNPPVEEDVDLGEIDDIDEGAEGDPPEADDVDAQPPEGGEDEPEDQPQERRQSRRERQQENWRQRALETEERYTRLDREIQELRTRQQQPPPDPYAQQRAQEAEAARVANMSYEDQLAYYRQQDRQQVNRAMADQEFRLSDRLDRADWQASTRDNPARARLSAQVEQTLQQYRARGQNVEREIIYKYLRGEELDRREREGGRDINRQRTAATRRVQRQTVRPASPRGGAERQGNRQMDADERLLRSTTVGQALDKG